MSSLSQIKRMSLVLAFMLVLICTSLWAQFPQGFEGSTTMPTGWTVYDEDADQNGFIVTAYNPHSGTNVARVTYNAAGNDDWLVTPALTITADQKVVKLWARSNSATYLEEFETKLSTTTNAVASFTVSLGTYTNIPNAWSEYVYDLSAYVGQTVYLAVHCNSVDELYFSVDDFDWVLGNDLMAQTLTGNPTPTVGVASPYVVTVKNNGGNAQSTYTVKLFKQGDVEIAALPGTQIAPGATADFNFTWTPATVETTSLYGKVILTGDANTANDQTADLAISVQSSGVISTYIGDPNTTTQSIQYPANFYWKNSISQCLYMADEINAGGLITSIKYYATLAGTIPPSMPLKVWMLNTDISTFATTADYIPASQFTLVFDGMVNLSATGAYELTIPLTTPFVYGGGNLCVMVNRPMDTTDYGSQNYWKNTATASYPNRTFYNYSDSNEIPLDNLTIGNLAGVASIVPNTTLLINTAGLSTLSGVVTTGTNTPVEGAKVAVDGTTRYALTNALGEYSLQYVTPGTVNLTTSKHGYINTTTTGVVLVAEETTTQNISINPLPTVVVAGQVNGSDTGAGLSGATVKLLGYENYEVTTNATGAYSFAAVYANNTYQIKVNAPGYQNYSGEVVVAAVNVTVPAITVNELANPPRNVVATVTPTVANVNWRTPSASPEVEFRYDDGTAVGQLGSSAGTTSTVLGAAHNHSATISSVKWMLTAEGGPHASVDVYVCGMTNGVPDESQILYHGVGIANTDAEWNTHTLPAAVEAPNGFFIGVAADGFIGLGMDDGLGDDYPFLNNTQYANLDITAESFAAIETLGAFAGNFTIRAMATDNGALDAPVVLAPITPAMRKITKGQNNIHLAYSNLTNPIITEIPGNNSPVSRSLVGYKVSRSTLANIGTPTAWELINNAVTDTSLVDATWAQVTSGTYKYIVQAKYSNNVLSNPAFSNEVSKDMESVVNITVNTADNMPATGAVVVLTNIDADPSHVYTQTATANLVSFPAVWRGTYNLTVTKTGYVTYTANNLVIQTNPFAHSLTLQVSDVFLTEGFEGTSFPPTGWTLVDSDGDSNNWQINVEGQDPFEGVGCAMSASYINNVGPLTPDNWLITPAIDVPANHGIALSYYVGAQDASWAAEHYSVMVSTTNAQPASFSPVYSETLESADFVQKQVLIDGVANHSIYVAFRHHDCTDMFMMKIDNIEMALVVAEDNPIVTPVKTTLKGNYPNPFNPITTISFDVAKEGQVSLDIYNVKGQKVKSLVNDNMTAGSHTIQWNGTDDNNKKVGSGIYFYNMKSGKYTSTRKMILMK